MWTRCEQYLHTYCLGIGYNLIAFAHFDVYVFLGIIDNALILFFIRSKFITRISCIYDKYIVPKLSHPFPWENLMYLEGSKTLHMRDMSLKTRFSWCFVILRTVQINYTEVGIYLFKNSFIVLKWSRHKNIFFRMMRRFLALVSQNLKKVRIQQEWKLLVTTFELQPRGLEDPVRFFFHENRHCKSM